MNQNNTKTTYEELLKQYKTTENKVYTSHKKLQEYYEDKFFNKLLNQMSDPEPVKK